MVSPFDLYQNPLAGSAVPDTFDADYYRELQKALFAESLKDQLLGLQSNYQSQLQARQQFESQLQSATNNLNNLNAQTKAFETQLANANATARKTQQNLASAKNLLDVYNSNIKSLSTKYNDLVKKEGAAANQVNTYLQNLDKNLRNAIGSNAGRIYSQLLRSSPSKAREYLLEQARKDNKFKQLETQWNNTKKETATTLSSLNTNKKAAEQQTQVHQNIQKTYETQVAASNKVQQDLKAHQNAINQVSLQVQQFNQQLGNTDQAAQKAVADAQAIQQNIANFQARETPIQELSSQLQGSYQDSLKASADELKNIASNALDPLSQRNAQNLLNTRAELLAQTFGKNVEDVKRELGLGITLAENQFTQDTLRSFMGLPTPQAAAQLQAVGPLNNQLPVAQEPIPVAQQPAPQTQPVTVQQAVPAQQPAQQPAAQPAAPSVQQPQVQADAPVQPVQTTPPAQETVQATTPAFNPLPIPTAPPTQQTQPVVPVATQPTGMPQAPAATQQVAAAPIPAASNAQPFGPLGDSFKKGFQRQIQQGFQNAMKIRSTPDVQKEQQRQAVTAQAQGAKPPSKPFGQGQNISSTQTQTNVTRGAGRRPVR